MSAELVNGKLRKTLRTGFVVLIACAVAVPVIVSAQGLISKRISAARTDSICIGDVSDPVCAVETWIACYALEKPDLCSRLGVKGMRFVTDDIPNIFDYKIVSVSPVTESIITFDIRQKGTIQSGQVEVRVMERWCTDDCRRLARNSFSPFVYYLAPIENHWQLAAWTNDTSVTCEYPDPRHTACKLYFWDGDTPWVHDQSIYEKYN
jgi:hypothetical protein